MNEIIVDNGPLGAYLDRSDRDHAWAKENFMRITRPLLTCEAVIAEALKPYRSLPMSLADACLVRMAEITRPIPEVPQLPSHGYGYWIAGVLTIVTRPISTHEKFSSAVNSSEVAEG
jgi:hypothetical protein